MLGRKSVLGICVLCALAFGAFAAANASAEQKAWECKGAAGEKDFTDPHCKFHITPGEGSFGHKEIKKEVKKAIVGTNGETAKNKEGEETKAAAVSKLLGALSGVVTEVQCSGLSGTGSMTNAAASVTGEGVLTYSGCTVTKPSGQGCEVEGGSIATENLEGTTVGQAANKLKFSPKSPATKFATIPIKNCTTSSLNNKFPVTGSLIADVTGATSTTTHEGVTTQNTLKFGGVKAGLEGALTIKTAKEKEIEENENPVTLT